MQGRREEVNGEDVTRKDGRFLPTDFHGLTQMDGRALTGDFVKLFSFRAIKP